MRNEAAADAPQNSCPKIDRLDGAGLVAHVPEIGMTALEFGLVQGDQMPWWCL